MSKEVRIPGPSHPITIEPTQGRVVVSAGDRVIARSDSALSLSEASYPAVQYVPLEDVEQSLLRPSTNETYCPYKGDASYYSVDGPDGEITDVVWTYESPYAAVSEIAGHVAFYPDRVTVSVE